MLSAIVTQWNGLPGLSIDLDPWSKKFILGLLVDEEYLTIKLLLASGCEAFDKHWRENFIVKPATAINIPLMSVQKILH